MNQEEKLNLIHTRAIINQRLAEKGMMPHGETVAQKFEEAAAFVEGKESPELIEELLATARNERAMDLLAAQLARSLGN